MSDLQIPVAAVREIAAIPTILEVVCRTTGMGFAAVARVTDEQWLACEVLDNIDFGLKSGEELKIETTICREVRQSREPVIINYVAEDEVYSGHPTPAMYGFQSYIAMPIILRSGSLFGTLCAIDPRPARLKAPEIVGMFKLFAELIAVHLDANEKLAISEASRLNERQSAQLREQRVNAQLAIIEADLLNARKASELREQFIAVLGHDLRNPLASIDAGIRMMQRQPLEEKPAAALRIMHGSVRRMAGLINNVMDFARGRLGNGLLLERENTALQPVLDQVVAELQTAHPDRLIAVQFNLSKLFNCDPERIAQLFSNLLGNAITHGALNTPIQVNAATTITGLTLSVTNTGKIISPDVMARLFQPFYRGHVRPSLQGLGLGLYIASQIAQAHGGQLTVSSTPEKTCFKLKILNTLA